MAKAFLSLGSNIEPRKYIRFAIEELKQTFDNIRFSDIYESKAIGFEGENFLNLVACFDVCSTLDELVAFCEKLEQMAGRVRMARGVFDSRTLDVDIILYGELYGQVGGLHLPSADIAEHAHVLLPLSELAEELIHPQLNMTYGHLCDQFFACEGNQKSDLLWKVTV